MAVLTGMDIIYNDTIAHDPSTDPTSVHKIETLDKGLGALAVTYAVRAGLAMRKAHNIQASSEAPKPSPEQTNQI